MDRETPSKSVISASERDWTDAQADIEVARAARRGKRPWEILGAGAVLGWFILRGAEWWLVLIVLFILAATFGIFELTNWVLRQSLEDEVRRLRSACDASEGRAD